MIAAQNKMLLSKYSNVGIWLSIIYGIILWTLLFLSSLSIHCLFHPSHDPVILQQPVWILFTTLSAKPLLMWLQKRARSLKTVTCKFSAPEMLWCNVCGVNRHHSLSLLCVSLCVCVWGGFIPVRWSLRPQVTLCGELMNNLDGITSELVALQLLSLCLPLSLLEHTV